MADFGERLFGHDVRAWSRRKKPSEIDFWGVDWASSWLGTETIVSAVWSVPQACDLMASEDHIKDGHVTNIKLTGGCAGEWEICVTVTTSGGRVREESYILVIEE